MQPVTAVAQKYSHFPIHSVVWSHFGWPPLHLHCTPLTVSRQLSAVAIWNCSGHTAHINGEKGRERDRMKDKLGYKKACMRMSFSRMISNQASRNQS